MTSLTTSLFSRILIHNIGLQQEQQIVIKFLVAEGVSSAEIHHKLAAVFKDDWVSCLRHVYLSSVLFLQRRQSVGDDVHIGVPRTTMTADNVNRVLGR